MWNKFKWTTNTEQPEELINGNWKLTNGSDYCRLYNNFAGTAYFNFAVM
jgi:hypothetical protein